LETAGIAVKIVGVPKLDDRLHLRHGFAMNEIRTLSERIDTLESRLTFLDETIETLNQTITAQWQQIDALKRQLVVLGERLREAEARSPGPANEPPPHY